MVVVDVVLTLSTRITLLFLVAVVGGHTFPLLAEVTIIRHARMGPVQQTPQLYVQ